MKRIKQRKTTNLSNIIYHL